MVKHTQTIRRQFVDELFECVWPFCGISVKGLKLPSSQYLQTFLAGIYLLKVNKRNTRTRCSGIFVVNFEHISHLVLVFLLLPLSR